MIEIEKESRRLWRMVYANVLSRAYMGNSDARDMANEAVRDYKNEFLDK